MLVLGILIGAVSALGIAKTARLLVTDGYGPVPTRSHAHPFDLR
jgi:hypothetical protein